MRPVLPMILVLLMTPAAAGAGGATLADLPADPCGTATLTYIQHNWEHLDADLKQMIPPQFRPRAAGDNINDDVRGEGHYCNEYLDTANFRLHYSTLPGKVEIPGSAHDITVSGDHAYVAAGSAGVQVVDITSPGEPLVVGGVDTPGTAQQIARAGSWAWVGDGAAGLQLIDISNPTLPRRVETVTTIDSVRCLTVSANHLFVGTDTGFSVLDVSVPMAPRLLATLPALDGAWQIAIAGSHAYVAAGADGLVIVDVASPDDPVVVADYPSRDLTVGIAVADTLAWLAEARAGVSVVSISDPTAPSLIAVTPAAELALATRLVAFDRAAAAIGQTELYHLILQPYFEEIYVLRGKGMASYIRGLAMHDEMLFLAVQHLGLQSVEVNEWGLHALDDMIHGWPDTSFRDSLAVILEASLASLTGEWEMLSPLCDGGRGGGQDLIDIYVYDIWRPGGQAYASYDGSTQNDCGMSGFGYIGMDNKLTTTTPMARNVVAHELFHLVQYAYNGWFGHWVLESMAVWAQRAAWPAGPSHSGMATWFRTPYLPFWSSTPTLRSYGGAHFWEFWGETTDLTFVRGVLERICTEGSGGMRATRDEVAARGWDFDQSLVEFALWNHATGERHDGHHYRRRIGITIGLQAEHHGYPVAGATLPADRVARQEGSNYLRFWGPGRSDSLSICFDGHPALRSARQVSWVATRAPNTHREWTRSVDAAGDCCFTLADWPSYDYVTMIVTNQATGAGAHELRYNYSARETGAPTVTELMRVGPNPVSGTTTIAFRLSDESIPVRLYIHDVSGRCIRRLVDGRLARGEHRVGWDGRGDQGQRVAAGVYFYRLQMGDTERTGRLVQLDQ